MNYKNFFLRIITLFLFTFSFIGYASSAHLKPEEYECKPESERSIIEKMVLNSNYESNKLLSLFPNLFGEIALYRFCKK